jgi:hypothetical protein
MARGRLWTPEEVEDLRRMYPDPSITPEEMERHFGRTWEGIRIYAARLGFRRVISRAGMPHNVAPRVWTPTEVEDLRRMYADPNVTHEEMEQRFGKSWNTIKHQATILGIRRPWTQTWSEEDEAIVREMYVDEDIPREAIIARLGRTWRSVCHKANELGVVRPKPNTVQARRDYFRVLDTDEKAYWLGFIAADGTVVAGPRQYSVILDLQPRELHWVQRFRDTLAPGATITKHGERSYAVCVASQELVGDLLRYGIGPRKSNTLEWPKIPEHAVIPFLLGYFDGDGCLVRRKDRNNGLHWSLLGTLPFLTRAREYIQQIAGISIKDPVRANKNTSPHLYCIHAYNEQVELLDSILNASGLGLPRKHLDASWPGFERRRRSRLREEHAPYYLIAG